MNSKGQKAGPNTACCVSFEPQTWRRTLCKNCFKTREQHDAAGTTQKDKLDVSSKDASHARNGSAKPLAPEQGESTKSPPETISVISAKTGQERRILKKNNDSSKKEHTTPGPDTTTKTTESTLKVEQEKIAVKPADTKQEPAKLDEHKSAAVQRSEKKKDAKTPDAKKTVADPVAKSSAAEKVSRDDGASKSKNKSFGSSSGSGGPGGVAPRAEDGENTSGYAVVGNRKAGGGLAGVAGGGDTGTGPPQVPGGGQADPSTDRSARQTKQEHVAAADVGSASGSPAGQKQKTDAPQQDTHTHPKASPSPDDDRDRDRANNERNRRDLTSEERRREVDELAAAVDDYDSPIIRAAREFIEDESKTESPKTTRRSNGSGESDRRTALYYHAPISEQNVDLARLGAPSPSSAGDGGDLVDFQLAKKELSLARRRRRRRQSADACSIKMNAPGMRMREDSMAEETRMLVENLRDKVGETG